jgi:PAS domain S-box-containing protein
VALLGIAVSLAAFVAMRTPATVRGTKVSYRFLALVTGLWSTAVAVAILGRYGNRSAVLQATRQELEAVRRGHERSEAALRESERFVRATLDAMETMVAVLDADGVVMAANRAWRSDDAGIAFGDVGTDYLAHCESSGDGEAPDVKRLAAGIREVLSGARDVFAATLEHPGARCSRTRVARFPGTGPVQVAVIHHDVTRFELARQELRRENRRLETLAEASPVGLFRTNAGGDVTYVNAQVGELCGVARDAAPDRRWAETVHPDDRDRLVASWRRMVAEQRPGEHRFRLVRPDGTVRECVVASRSLRDDRGRPEGFVGAVLDVTESRRAEETLRVALRDATTDAAQLKVAEARLRESEARLRALADSLPAGIFVCDRTGDCIYTNRAWTELSGLEAGDNLGRWAAVIPPADRATLLAGSCEQEGRPYRREFPVRRPDGGWRWVHLLVQPLQGTAGDPLAAGFVGTVLDVTERRSAEDEMRAQMADLERRTEARLRERDRLFAADLDMRCLVDATRLTKVNPAMVEALGYPAEELLARPLLELVHPDDRAPTSAWLGRVRTGEAMLRFENRLRRRDGAWRSISWTAIAVGPDVVACSGRDATESVTERRRTAVQIEGLRAALTGRARALADANRELEALSTALAHDLRVPLRAIERSARPLHDERGRRLDADSGRCLGIVRVNALRMGYVIEALRDLSRLGGGPTDRARVDMHALARAIVDELGAHQPDREVVVSVDALAPAHGEATLLRHLLGILLANAFSGTTEVAYPCVDVGSVDHEGTPVYYVRDNGAGFDVSDAGEPSHAVERLRLPQDSGDAGMGLALVRRIVERHGGRMWAEGRAGEGTTVFFTLGQAAAAQPSASPPARAAAVAPGDAPAEA